VISCNVVAICWATACMGDDSSVCRMEGDRESMLY
jgi:hypothetical protein